MKNIKIGIFGGTGRMGQEISKVIFEKKGLELVFAVGKNASYKKLKCDVAIDFSSSGGFLEALKFALDKKIPFVSGSTGLSEDDFNTLKAASKKIPVLWAPNMSPGVAALKKAIESFAGIKNYDFHIDEWHHTQKKDKPSGTALAIAEKLKSVTGKKQIPIKSVRAGGIFGVHKVFAIGQSEYLEIAHYALNRKVFAEGAVRAAQWIFGRKPALYTMEDLV